VGRIGGIILALALSAAAAIAAAAAFASPWVGSQPQGVQIAVVALGTGVIALVFSLPLGFIFDRSVASLRSHLERSAAGESAAPPPCLFRGIGNACMGVIDSLRTKMTAQDEQIRDLRVRSRIMETERDQLRGVLGAMRDAVVVTDAFDEVVHLNDAAKAIFREATAAAGSADRAVIDAVIKDQRLRQAIRETREAGDVKDSRVIEHEIAAEGRSTAYQVMLSCLPNHKDEVGAVVTVLHDLSREREVAEMKSEFVSKASHELRTPLSSIRAYVEMLVDGEANDEAARREFYTIIQNETERLSRMIDNMLNISRIEAGIIQIERVSVDFRTLLSRAVETLGPQAREKDIGLSVKAPPVDLTAEGDADMLYQVVLNLLSNSIKYTPAGGRVTLTADSDNLTRSVVVSVQDTGLGIPPDALPRLFEKFYRIENFKRVAKGTGLGLNLCKHIVETVHKGQIGVESKLGMGSKFWFSVPMTFAGAKAA